MTGGSIREAVACPAALLEQHSAGRMASHRTLAELLSNESIGIQKPTPLAAVDASNATVTYDVENGVHEEPGLQQRRADSAHARTQSDALVQSASQSASLELAWRVVFAAEQRKAALMEHTRPMGCRRRRSEEKNALGQRDGSDRPVARNFPPRVGLGGAGNFPLQVISATASAQDADCLEKEELDRSRDSRMNPSSREAAAIARRRAQSQSIAAEPNCGIAVSGQSLIVRRPTTPNEADEWAQDGALPTNARYLIENDMGHPSPAFIAQDDSRWHALSAASAQMQATSSTSARSEVIAQTNGASAVNTGWTDDVTPASMIHRALPLGRHACTTHSPFADKAEIQVGTLAKWSESSLERPRTSGEPEHASVTDRPRTTGDSDHVTGHEFTRTRATASTVGVGRELRYAPSLSDDNDGCGELHVEGSHVDSSVSVEKGSSSANLAASARVARRTTFSLAPRVAVANASRAEVAVSSSTTTEPLSPQRLGAAMRRSRSMPAPRKSAEESAPKSKLARSFTTRQRSLNSSSMPKSTAATAAGTGAVAAKKRAKSSKKLMLPFAYAEDDPRVRHVESAEAPEARIPQFSSGQ